MGLLRLAAVLAFILIIVSEIMPIAMRYLEHARLPGDCIGLSEMSSTPCCDKG